MINTTMLQDPSGEAGRRGLAKERSHFGLVRAKWTACWPVGCADFAYLEHLESVPALFSPGKLLQSTKPTQPTPRIDLLSSEPQPRFS